MVDREWHECCCVRKIVFGGMYLLVNMGYLTWMCWLGGNWEKVLNGGVTSWRVLSFLIIYLVGSKTVC